jgi:nucleotide-binding universal stress UspA family protein
MSMETILIGARSGENAGRVAATAAELATATGATVVVGHVFDPDDYDDVRRRMGIAPDAEVTADDVARRVDAVDDVTDRLRADGVRVEVRGRVGEAGPELVDLAEDVEADLVIVGGRRRSPTGKALFGSTAQEVLMSAPCPVTFVRAGE